MCLHMCTPSPIESQMLDKSQSYSIVYVFQSSMFHLFIQYSPSAKVLHLYVQQLQCDFGTRNSIYRSYPTIPKATSCPWFGISGSVNCWSVVLSLRPLEKWWGCWSSAMAMFPDFVFGYALGRWFKLDSMLTKRCKWKENSYLDWIRWFFFVYDDVLGNAEHVVPKLCSTGPSA